MKTMTIRFGRVADAPQIAQLTTQLGYDLDVAAATERLTRILPRPEQQLFVADVEGRAVGWLHAVVVDYVDAARFVMIAGLVVDRAQRRTGVGRALMARAEAWAGEQGCSLVRLTSSATRTAAHRFYEEIGYTNIKTQFSFIKSLDGSGADPYRAFVPRVDPT
jgi:GNAT superfamily N-acetyltransferase